MLVLYCILSSFFHFPKVGPFLIFLNFVNINSLLGKKTTVLTWWEEKEAPVSGVGTSALSQKESCKDSLAQQRGCYLANNTGRQNKLLYFVLISIRTPWGKRDISWACMPFCFISYFLCKSICLRGLRAKRQDFLCVFGYEVGGTRAWTRVWRDRNSKKINMRNKISQECLSEFYIVNHLQGTGKQTKIKKKLKIRKPFDFYDGIFIKRVTGHFTADTLTFTIFQTQRSALCSLSDPGSHVLLLIQSGLLCFRHICNLYT